MNPEAHEHEREGDGQADGPEEAGEAAEELDLEAGESMAGVEEMAAGPFLSVLGGLAAALALAVCVCAAGALLVLGDRVESRRAAQPTAPRHARRPTPVVPATPALAQVQGLVLSYNAQSGALLVRSGGMALEIATGANTTYGSACVAPSHLHAGQRVLVGVQGHSNGALNAARVSDADPARDGCPGPPAAAGTTPGPSQAAALPGSDSVPPPPAGGSAAGDLASPARP